MLAFARFGTDAKTPLVCVCNLSPVPRHGYRVGMPHRGRWREVASATAELAAAEATVRVIEKNLTIIDAAITEARRALASDTASAYLNLHLADTMRRKLQLLRTATSLARAQS